MKYFIGMSDVEWSDDRWLHKGGTGHEPERREGHIGLWDRNSASFQWFKIIEPTQNHYGWIVESEVPPCSYWQNQIRPA